MQSKSAQEFKYHQNHSHSKPFLFVFYQNKCAIEDINVNHLVHLRDSSLEPYLLTHHQAHIERGSICVFFFLLSLFALFCRACFHDIDYLLLFYLFFHSPKLRKWKKQLTYIYAETYARDSGGIYLEYMPMPQSGEDVCFHFILFEINRVYIFLNA